MCLMSRYAHSTEAWFPWLQVFKGVTALLNVMLVRDRVSDVKDACVEDSHLTSSLSILTFLVMMLLVNYVAKVHSTMTLPLSATT